MSEQDELEGMASFSRSERPHPMDATIWAEEFVMQFPEFDKGVMVKWFDGAIMAGYDTATMMIPTEEQQ